ncbi:MAG TPA: nucleotide exchange factor GrpE [Hanamia sp.]|jgi:Molecular chaperone GrpE (heat shock protein)
MKNNKKEMYDDESNNPVEAKDFSVNENDNPSVEQEETIEPSDTNERTEKLEKELEEQKDKYIRLFAEFDNFKRRTSKENIELRQTAGKEVITSLLDVLDDMDRAEKQMQESEEEKTLKEGILLVFNKFRKILESKGLKSIETLNTDFDVEKDEAVSEVAVEDEKLKGKVVAELQKGYFLNDKLIRFAKVVVGK